VSAPSPPVRWGSWLAGAAALYGAYTVAFTWPLVIHAGDHVRAAPIFGWVDLDLHLWTLAWVCRTIVRAPLRLFDANVFYPARLTLAGSDHLLGTLPVAGPVYWLTGNPVATLNVVVLTSFPLAGLATFALVAATTRSGWAGLLAGFVYAFAPWRTHSFVPVQTFSIQYLPIALLGVTAYLRDGRRAWLVAGVGALTIQLLVAYYVAYAALVTLGVWLVAIAVREQPPARRWVALAVGLGVALVVVAAVTWPYVLRREGGAIRAYGGALGMTTLWNWAGPALLTRTEHVYLGFVVLALAAAACVPPWREGTGRWLAVAVVGWILCLGSHVEVRGVRVPLPYSWLAAIVPGFSSMRVALRFFTVVTLGVGGLAGFGLARARERTGIRLGAAIATVLFAAVLWEYRPLEWPMPLDAVPTGSAVPAAYRWLAEHGDGGPLLELPLGPEDSIAATRRESRAMYWSTVHWLPLLNGYTAYPPRTHALLMRVARQLPDAQGLETLVDLVDVRWILVHLDAVPESERLAWTAVPGLELAARFDTDVVFAVRRAPSADRRRALLDPTPGRTVGGVDTAPLPAAARAGRVEAIRIPESFPFAAGGEAVVRIVNGGTAPWPGLALDDDGVVRLVASWGPTDAPVAVGTQSVGLPRDLAPGDAVVVRFALRPPGAGVYRLTLALAQSRTDVFPRETAPPLVRTVDVLRPR